MVRWCAAVAPNEISLSDFRPSPVYQYAHKERPAERARIGLRRETRARDVFSRRPDFVSRSNVALQLPFVMTFAKLRVFSLGAEYS